MTVVTIRKTKTGQYDGFTCAGHAGYAGRGRDIVCASVSILVINTINVMEKLISEPVLVTENEADGFIECRFVDTPSDKSVLLMDAMIFGLKEIKKEYGKKFIDIIVKEV